MSALTPRSAAIKTYYERRDALAAQRVFTEMSVREPFKGLLEQTAGAHGWTLVVEQRVETAKRRITPDGTMRDANTLPRGYWEAKDTGDDLDAEIERKFALGYPRTNILFEDTRRAVLYQAGAHAGEYDLTDPAQVAALLNRFYAYREPNIEGFEAAVERFKQDTPDLAKGLLHLIDEAHRGNKTFQSAFAAFMEVCRASLNPNISTAAVDEMLIQHLLTERLMRTVFDNADFTRRNVIAREVEKVIDALTSRSFNRHDFLGQLNYFYEAIERAAQDLEGFSERQAFINTVYERFFQGYAVKVADTHGIVYTPQPIVDFMCAAVEEVLHDAFGLALTDPGVCIIDPCTGTGNFVINLLGRMARQNPAALPDAYANRLFANEVMLLPYYVASLNIEHAYYDLTGRYEPFEGICFVDTLDLAEGAQMKLSFMTEANSARVERQKAAPITVIIGNPPYNMGQVSENDNNKNRTYEVIDSRLQETYVRDSKATLRNKLYDPYVKFFRWASDRLQGRDGIVCFISNNSFVDQIAFDGMRKHLLQDFTTVYHLDLHGNVRQNPKISGTSHNVFGIQVGVGVTVAIRKTSTESHKLFYHRVPEMWRREDKLSYLSQMVREDGRQNALNTVEWQDVVPDFRHSWIIPETNKEFSSLIPLGDKRSHKSQPTMTIFSLYSLGVATNRDNLVYGFDIPQLSQQVTTFIEIYNSTVDKLLRPGSKYAPQELIDTQDPRIKWTRQVKRSLEQRKYSNYSADYIRQVLYRPFSQQHLYFDNFWNEERYQQHLFFPSSRTEEENKGIALTTLGSEKPFMVLMVKQVSDLHLVGAGAGSQTFPFYTYDEDGSNRRENITDWALEQFRAHYENDAITKWDIFYYVYAILHHPLYRERFAANLRRDLPRIPYAPDFHDFAAVGKQLADLHLDYETVDPYPLEYAWTPDKPVDWRVEKMRLNRDKTALQVNASLTLRGIPPEAFDYRLGSRSALEWVIDQYQVKTDARSGIVSDPNRYSDDERYIVNLVGRVIHVSVETVGIIAGMGGIGVGW